MRPGSGGGMGLGAVLAVGSLIVTFAAPPTDARSATPRSWPFAAPRELRSAKARDALPGFYADGKPCSVGCRAPGAIPGWPVRPFHRAHVLRAGLNELRPGNLHFGVDVLARDGTPVYAMQGGNAQVLASAGPDARVRVGSFEYWHIRPLVGDGQYVRPYADVVGRVLKGAGHVHVSELSGDRYINPLRPGGRVLAPWRDTASPVLGLAGLAYRLYDERGRRGALRWAFRGTQHLPNGHRRSIYAPGSHPAAAKCAALRHPCRPNWVYRLAGGLAPRLDVRPRRAYRLTAYAYDWAGHRSALDTRVVFVRGQAFLAPAR